MKTELKTLDIFPDEHTRKGAIETLASCVLVLTEELARHVSLKEIPVEVAYHIGLGMNILGGILGRTMGKESKFHDISYSDADYDQKLELIVAALIELRDNCRGLRKNEHNIIEDL